MNKKIAIELAVGIIVLIALIIGGSIWVQNKRDNAPVVSEIINPNNLPRGNNQNLEIANPASVYCQENGGKLEIAGNQTGICTLTDGTKCEEWAYMRGECGYDMKDWKAYNGQKKGYAFELKFPKEWVVEEFGGYPPSFSNNCVYENGDRCASFSVFGLLDATADTKLVRDVNLDLTGKYPDKLITEELIEVSGESALLTEYYQSSLGNDGELQRRVRVDIKIIHNGKVYRFTMEESGKGTEKFTSSADWKYKRELNAILSSVKFTDMETANWKTYKNEKLGFEVKYPQNWITDGFSFNSPETEKELEYIRKNKITTTALPDITIHYFEKLTDKLNSVSSVNGNPKTLEDFLKDKAFVSHFEEINLSGEKAWFIKNAEDDLIRIYSVYVEHNGHSYEIDLSSYFLFGKTDDFSSLPEISKHFFSTFRFIN